MLERFVQLTVIREADCLVNINYEDRQLQVQDNQLKFVTRQFIREQELEGTTMIQLFYQ